jgi:hypothetical protein
MLLSDELIACVVEMLTIPAPMLAKNPAAYATKSHFVA